ncbi:MFS transporter [Pseudomonas sp. MWU16-30317]|uniref:MFS transporter n=1 Tax=Pseudomonas sp. MWU16-30317 TaxID=2878095 RepID=UPI001CFB5728|nr:MFS transporter [Pseudomonas sp. MWU16-30317]
MSADSTASSSTTASGGFADRTALVYLSFILVSFLAASSAPTPLYHLYQEAWGFSSATLTLIFAVYAFSLLLALLTVGSLSDYLGRRPVLLLALLLEIPAMLLFIYADSVAWLIAARLLQGFATGMATSVLGAALIDYHRDKGPLINSLSPLIGMAVGAFGTSVLLQYAPWPLQLSYIAMLGCFVVQVLLLWRLRESVSPQPGALASLRPALSVPPQARQALLRMLPVDVATWSLGGFFLSLAPSLVRAATGSTSNLLGGALVATMTLSGALAIAVMRHGSAQRSLVLGASFLAAGAALILLAMHSGGVLLFFIGTVVAGAGFGSGFLGSVRSVMPLALAHERAGLMATFYVLSYLAFCLPALCAGFAVQHFGLIATSDGYAIGLICLCLLALFGLWRKPAAAALTQ